MFKRLVNTVIITDTTITYNSLIEHFKTGILMDYLGWCKLEIFICSTYTAWNWSRGKTNEGASLF